MATWTCPGCGTPYSQNDPDLIVRHVSECDYVDGAGQDYPVTVKWSVTCWHIATVNSSDLAAATGAQPFAKLTAYVLDPDENDPGVGLPGYLDELAGECDGTETDGLEISRIYDARLDQPRRAGTEGEMT